MSGLHLDRSCQAVWAFLKRNSYDAVPNFESLGGSEECVPCSGVVRTAPLRVEVDSVRVRHVGVAYANVDQRDDKSAGASSSRAFFETTANGPG